VNTLSIFDLIKVCAIRPKKWNILSVNYLSETIIKNFIDGLSDAEIVKINALGDEDAFGYICRLYEKSYGTYPSGAGIYLLRTKFNLGTEITNRKYIPNF
jgi:hypothetical protein